MLGFDFKKVSSVRRFRDEFEDLGSVGSGGFAQVHRVTHILTNIEYAIKIIKIKPSNSSEQTEQKIYRLMSEPKTHATLSHPNILQYHGCWIELQPYTEQEKQETIYEEDQSEPQFEMVVMNKSGGSDDIVFGSQSHGSSQQKKMQQTASKVRQWRAKLGDGSKIVDYKQMRVYIISELCTLNLQNFIYLRNLSNKSQSLTPKDIYNCFFLALQMIAGLNYLHSKRIIHRDIKLHNIMINKQGRCKLIDFGLAKKVKYWKNSIEDHYYFKGKEQMSEKEGDDQQLSSSIGTKLFSSPQQATSQNYDFRTDIYSLGIVIVLLFSSYTTSHQERDLLQKIRKRSLQDMSIPQPLKCLLFKCLGQQNERPSLGQLQKCIKELMKQLISSQKDIHKNGFKRNSPLNYQSQEERLLIANRTKIVK